MTAPRAATGGSAALGLPRWLGPANRVIVLLQRLGIAFFTFELISIPGRRTGRLRTTPVSPLTVDGRRYLVSVGQTEWVRNARAAGRGVLSRGRRGRRVRLVELGPEARVPVLRHFPVQIPRGVPFLLHVGAFEPPGDPDAFAAAAERLAVFEAVPED
jgi:hypothetical protein